MVANNIQLIVFYEFSELARTLLYIDLEGGEIALLKKIHNRRTLMNQCDELIDFSEVDSNEPVIDSGAARFADEYQSFEFEAMSLVPYALTVSITRQH